MPSQPTRLTARPIRAALLLIVLLTLFPCRTVSNHDSAASDLPGLTYRRQVRSRPRPLRIHHLQADLQHPSLELTVVAGEGPEGDSRAQATLQDPLVLARDNGLLAAVNTNPFGPVPEEDGSISRSWSIGQPVTVLGWTVASGKQISPPQKRYPSFFIDEGGRPRLQTVDEPLAVRQAAAGFGFLLRQGEIMPRPGGALHPRTAIGLDAEGRYLHLVVVDGRQKNFSEGMTTRELAELMAELGCHEAVNLDGGGSSIMLLHQGSGLRQVNRSSGRNFILPVRRPVPTLLGIRRTDPHSQPAP